MTTFDVEGGGDSDCREVILYILADAANGSTEVLEPTVFIYDVRGTESKTRKVLLNLEETVGLEYTYDYPNITLPFQPLTTMYPQFHAILGILRDGGGTYNELLLKMLGDHKSIISPGNGDGSFHYNGAGTYFERVMPFSLMRHLCKRWRRSIYKAQFTNYLLAMSLPLVAVEEFVVSEEKRQGRNRKLLWQVEEKVRDGTYDAPILGASVYGDCKGGFFRTALYGEDLRVGNNRVMRVAARLIHRGTL
jgi:hypothetical protein